MQFEDFLLPIIMLHVLVNTSIIQGSSCPQPPIPEGGNIHPKQNIYSTGDTVTYSCHGNTLQSIHENLTCLTNNTWDNDAPYCDDPIAIDQGKLTSNGITLENRLPLDGNYSTCISPTTPWSIYKVFLEDRNVVRAVRITANSDIDNYRIHLMGETHQTVLCNDRYYETGHQKVIFCEYPKLTNTIMMMKTGKLSSHSELCEVEVYALEDDRPCITRELFIQNGVITYNTISAHLLCNEGFQPIGNASSSCYNNGSWSNLLDCIAMPCQFPSHIPEGKGIIPTTNATNKTEFVIGTSLELHCDNALDAPRANITIRCEMGGFWSIISDTSSCIVSEISNSTFSPQLSAQNDGELRIVQFHVVELRYKRDFEIQWCPQGQIRVEVTGQKSRGVEVNSTISTVTSSETIFNFTNSTFSRSQKTHYVATGTALAALVIIIICVLIALAVIRKRRKEIQTVMKKNECYETAVTSHTNDNECVYETFDESSPFTRNNGSQVIFPSSQMIKGKELEPMINPNHRDIPCEVYEAKSKGVYYHKAMEVDISANRVQDDKTTEDISSGNCETGYEYIVFPKTEQQKSANASTI